MDNKNTASFLVCLNIMSLLIIITLFYNLHFNILFSSFIVFWFILSVLNKIDISKDEKILLNPINLGRIVNWIVNITPRNATIDLFLLSISSFLSTSSSYLCKANSSNICPWFFLEKHMACTLTRHHSLLIMLCLLNYINKGLKWEKSH